jgi:hypothetical protein
MKMALMQGFCAPLNADPGQRIEFRTSTTADSYTVTFLRFRNANPDEVEAEDIWNGRELIEEPLRDSFVLPGLNQRPHAPDESCVDWPRVFMLDVPEDWTSGMYAAKCVDDEGALFYIFFIVNPHPDRRKKILVLSNTNTWNAYNDMGGYSRYETSSQSRAPGAASYNFTYYRPNANLFDPSVHDGEQSPLSPWRAAEWNVPYQSKHLARAEMWFLNWLEGHHEFDLTTDLDWHFGVADVASYKLVILHTHPEYWTQEMVDNLQAYLDAGGNLIYLGGNGIYEKVDLTLTDDDLFMTVFGDDQHREPSLFRNIGRPESLILGIKYGPFNRDAANPYIVFDDRTGELHPFLQNLIKPDGTLLVVGDSVGEVGWNIPLFADSLEHGAASGIEMDVIDNNSKPDGLRTLGIAKDGNSHMTYYDHQGGGFVFSIGSVRVCGSLAIDGVLQQIVLRAIDTALK